MPLQAFRNGQPIGALLSVGSAELASLPFGFSRAVEINAAEQGEWTHQGARFELEDGEGRRVEVTPRAGMIPVIADGSVSAAFVVLYDGRTPFGWP